MFSDTAKLHRSVTLRKEVHPGIHTATTSPCLVTRRKSQRSLMLQRFSDSQKMYVPRHSHSHYKSIFSDKAKLHRCIVQ